MRGLRRAAAVLCDVGTISAVALTAHTAYNLTRLRTPGLAPADVTEKVSILIPARNEAHRIGPCITALLHQRGLVDAEVLVLDDESDDNTAAVVTAVFEANNGDAPAATRLIAGTPRPDGWLGKAWACAQLAQAAQGSVLVFVDADVVVAPHGIAATIELMRQSGLDACCPYPRQEALTPAERLIQPLLQWSWLTTLPLTVAESSRRPALTAANGQLMAIDASSLRAMGGHASIRQEVLDDIALMRALKEGGGRGGVVDGTAVAHCRMYEGWNDLRDGYSKSLWSAFGSPAGAAAALGLLGTAYVVPAIGALTGRRSAVIGVAAGVAGRALVARRTGGRVWPDALTHPASIGVLGFLTVRSQVEHRRGRLTWKGRSING